MHIKEHDGIHLQNEYATPIVSIMQWCFTQNHPHFLHRGEATKLLSKHASNQKEPKKKKPHPWLSVKWSIHNHIAHVISQWVFFFLSFLALYLLIKGSVNY